MGGHTHITAAPTRILDIMAIMAIGTTRITGIMVTGITGIRRGESGI